MKAIHFIFLLVISTLISQKSKAQDNEQRQPLKNRIDFMVLGNRGFLNLVYNRIVFENKAVSIIPHIGNGIIPGSHDHDTIPGYLNFAIGSTVELGIKFNKLVLGICYSLQNKYGADKPTSTTKKYTNGLLGEVGYSRGFKNTDFVLKISFTPILLGNKYRQLENAPFGLSLCSRL